MSTLNAPARELSAKVVYYGPGLSGKTTSLRQVYAAIRPETRGQLVSLSTEGDRTLFFDFLPVKVEPVGGLALRLQLYTVPGQVFYDATRKLVLNGADGVVFVADSQQSAMGANLESIKNLEANLAELGIDLGSFPLVFQYNKRDLPGVVPVKELSEKLNRFAAPELETVASLGQGLLPALREITRLVVKDLKSRQPHRLPARPLGPLGAPLPPPSTRAMAPPSQPPAPPEGPLPAAAMAAARGSLGGLSFARLFKGRGTRVAEVELLIRERAHDAAVRRAAEGLSELLGGLPGGDAPEPARALLIGLDGREYLRLRRAVALPVGTAGELDALFALYLLVAATVKALAIPPPDV